MDHVGDNDGSDIGEQRKKKRRDELVFVVGKRCFAMAKAMQTWLEKEFWPKEQRDGLEDKDCRVPNLIATRHMLILHSPFGNR